MLGRDRQDDDSVVQVDQQELGAAKDALRQLDKLLKTTALFGSRHGNVARAKEELEAKVRATLASYGKLVLDLDGAKIFYKGVLVTQGSGQKDDPFLRLFQDGVVELQLLPKLDSEELDTLVGILLANFQTGPYCHDDTVTLYWEARPKHFRFVVSKELEDIGGEEGRGSAEGTEAYRHVRVALAERRAKPGPQAASVTASSQSMQLMHLEQFFRQGAFSLTEAEAEELRREVAAGETGLAGKYVEVLLRVLAYPDSDLQRKRAVAVMGQLFLGLVEGAGIVEACGLLERLQRLAADSSGDPGIRRAVDQVLVELGNPELITRVIRSLAPRTPGEEISEERIGGALRFLGLLGPVVIPVVLDHLEHVPNPDLRLRIAGLLARIGSDQVPLFRERLTSQGDRIARELLQILATISSEEALEAMLQAALHPRIEIRLAVLGHVAGLRTKPVASALVAWLGDKEERLRVGAMQQLEKMVGDDFVSRRLRDLIRAGDFQYRDKEEKRRIFALFGTVGGDQTVSFFRECFETKNTFKRAAIDEFRACGAYMLGVLGDGRSRQALEKAGRSKLASPFLKWACHQALGMLEGKIEKTSPSGRG